MKTPTQLNRRHFNALAAAAALTGSWPLRAYAREPVLLIVGDSLSAEYGLRRGTGWVALLEQRLRAERRAIRVVNASISGDTTAGGRSRLPALLRSHQPAVVVLALGSNDALRGLPLDMSRDHLRAMVRACLQAGARVLLVGMEMPPNYGARHIAQFRQLFIDVASAEQVPLLPFLLRGVADAPDPLALFQSDRIHPNEAAQPIMLDNVWPPLRGLLPAA